MQTRHHLPGLSGRVGELKSAGGKAGGADWRCGWLSGRLEARLAKTARMASRMSASAREPSGLWPRRLGGRNHSPPNFPKIVLPIPAGKRRLRLEMMAYNLTKPTPGRSAMRPKNRIWGFSRNGRIFPLAALRQRPEPRRKSRPTPTIFTPGIPQWPSRDPMEDNWETGEFNEYAFIINEAVAAWDYLGMGRQGGRNTVPEANRGPVPDRVPTRIDQVPLPVQRPAPMLPTGGGPNQTGDSGGTTRRPAMVQSPPSQHPPTGPGIRIVTPNPTPPGTGRTVRGLNPKSIENGRIDDPQSAVGEVVIIAADSAQRVTARLEAKRQCDILAMQARSFDPKPSGQVCDACQYFLYSYTVPHGGPGVLMTIVANAAYYKNKTCGELGMERISHVPVTTPTISPASTNGRWVNPAYTEAEHDDSITNKTLHRPPECIDM